MFTIGGIFSCLNDATDIDDNGARGASSGSGKVGMTVLVVESSSGTICANVSP